MVRLRAVKGMLPNCGAVVSIPKWCDWEQPRFSGFFRFGLVSIPKWCDWESFCLKLEGWITFVSIPKWCDWEQCRGRQKYRYNMFQFQNGAIESQRGQLSHYILDCFNSKMVRLRAPLSLRFSAKLKSFNSKMVRLRVRVFYCYVSLYCVSIPKWCDWEQHFRCGRDKKRPFQFQNGAIERQSRYQDCGRY